MGLLNPECFCSHAVKFGIIRLETFHPRVHGRQYFSRCPSMQFMMCSVMRSPFVFAKLSQDVRNRFPELSGRFDQWTTRVDKPVNAASSMVTVRVTLAVLHMADQSIRPVTEPHGTVRANLRISGSEMFIGRSQQIVGRSVSIFYAFAVKSTPVVIDCESRESIHVNHAGVRKLPLNIVRKMAADEKFTAEGRTHPFVVKDKV